MKRVVLFLMTNLAVMLVLSVVTSLLGVNRFLTANGLNLGMLLAFAAVIGFGGSFISLLMSKTMAKWSTGARVIEHPSSSTEVWLIDTVGKLAKRANLPMPEVAIYDGEPNAFATGASKNSSLVAVSTSHTSVDDDGCSMTRAPVLHLAMVFDMSSEMKAPPKPITAAKASSMPRFRPLAVRKRLTPSRLATTLSTSMTARLVARKSRTRFMANSCQKKSYRRILTHCTAQEKS